PLGQQPLFLPPHFEGHVLVTTRASALRRIGIAQPIIIDAFSAEQGALFLLRRAGLFASDAALEQAIAPQRVDALHISRELDGLTLALDQACAYKEATGTSIEAYSHTNQQHRAELLNERRGRGQDHPEPVATT